MINLKTLINMEYSVNLPEVTMNDLEGEAMSINTESEFDKALLTAIDNIKVSEAPKAPKRKRAVEGQEELKELKAFYEYNKDIDKYEVFVILKDSTKKVLYVRNNPNASKTMLINAKGHGAKLEAFKITTIQLTTKEGQVSVITKDGVSEPKAKKVKALKAPKQPKALKETKEEKKERKKRIVKEFKPFKVTAYGGEKLEGKSKEGMVISTAGGYVVEFKEEGKTAYTMTFSAKTGVQRDNNNPYHTWKLNVAEIKPKKKLMPAL